MDYIIAIGGTGARILTSIVHMAACGLICSDKLEVMIVDPDNSNGNTTGVVSLIKNYNQAYDRYHGDSMFKTKITLYPENGDNTITPLDKKHMCLESLAQDDNSANLLMKALFTEQEREQELSKGFRAHPSIGSVIFSEYCNKDSDFNNFFKRIAGLPEHSSEAPANILVIGSLFGGTGAAGLPTIPKFLKQFVSQPGNEVNRDVFNLGGIFALPYFSIKNSESAKDNGIKIEPQMFLVNSVSALNYYINQNFISDQEGPTRYDRVYTVGTAEYKEVGDYHFGGREQNNHSSFAELFAAFAANDFFNNKASHGKCLAGLYKSQNENLIDWEGINNLYGNDQARLKIMAMLRSSYVFFSHIYYSIFDYNGTVTKRKYGFLNPPHSWYRNYVEADKLNFRSDIELANTYKHIKEYFTYFVEWISQILEQDNMPSCLTDIDYLNRIRLVAAQEQAPNSKDFFNTLFEDIGKIDPANRDNMNNSIFISKKLAALGKCSSNHNSELIKKLYEICSS